MKAFDKTSHLKLIHKLRANGFGCKLIDWFSAQRRATLKKESGKRLEILGLTDLRTRRERGDF